MHATTNNSATTSQVTVIGLGAMGSAIAKTFVERGYRTTVWNRTASKSAPLVEAGATAAGTLAEAVTASPLIVFCLLDGTAVDDVLAQIDDAAGSAVAGRTLVNLTSGSPERAREHARWVDEHDAQYLDGKLMGDPPYIGTSNIVIPISGSGSAWTVHEETLKELGGVGYQGEDAGLAAVEFMAQVAVAYELLIGYLHVLRLIRAEGGDLVGFAERVGGSLPAFPGLLTSMARAVDTGAYAPDLGPLDVQAALMDDMISHRESVGVEAVRMREVKKLMDRRIAGGHGDQGFSSLFEELAASGRS